MAFIKKLWKDRISEFPNRRTINDGHTVKQATIGRDEGIVTEEGDDFSAQNMNDLEQRIEDCFGDVQALVGYEVAQQYNQSSVIFDPVATEGHGSGFVVSSDYIAKLKIENLKDVEINSPQPNQALVFDLTDPDNPKLVNGEVSTVGNLDDLSDVDTTGKANDDSLRYDNANHKWVAKPVTVVMSQSAWEGMSSADKTAWINSHKNTHLILSDAPNLNATASDIEYSSGVSVADKLDDLAIIEQLYNQNSITVYKVGSVIQMCFSYAKISDIASMFSAYVPSYNVDYPIWNSTKTQFSVLRFNSGNLYVLDTSNWSVIPNTSSDGLLGTITFFKVV